MTTDAREKTLVVIQLTGGNDFMNTLVPYTNEHYYDARKKIVIGPVSYTHLTLPTILLV